MIFVLLGTHEQQFNRLIKAVELLPSTMPKIIQYGYSNYKPEACELYQFIQFDQVVEYMKTADVVITHSGTGCVMLALSLGRSPIVAPRYRRYGEHVDDHQLQLCNHLTSEALITPYYDTDNLADRINENLQRQESNRKIEPDPRLITAVSNIILNE